MTLYVFKLNLQPDVLHHYISMDELDYLKNEVVYQAFMNVFDIEQFKGYSKISFIENERNKFSEEFQNLEKETIKLNDLYTNIMKRFLNDGEIYYSKDFLSLNDKCGNARRLLEYDYPALKSAYEFYEDETTDKLFELNFNNSVGTGITHIRKFFTLKRYLEENELDIEGMFNNTDIYYDSFNELFYIKEDTPTDAIGCSRLIEKSLNSNNDIKQKLGVVNINPVYSSVEIKGELKEIGYTIVYPNANGPHLRNDILTSSNAKQKEVKLLGSNGKPLNKEPIVEELNTEAKKGYLKEFYVRGAQFIKNIKRVASLPIRNDMNE